MKTKKFLAFIACITLTCDINAQIKVFTGGNTIIGTTNNPVSGAKFQVAGTSVYTTATGTVTPTSAPLIQSVNAYSTAGAPDYTWSGDLNTGLFHPGPDTLAFTTGGGKRIHINPNGNIAIGNYVPKEFFQLGDRFTFHNGGTKYLGFNSYYDAGSGTNKRLVADYASTIAFGGGDISFNVATTSTAGSAITFTNALHIKNDSKIGIGTTAPASAVAIGDAGNSLYKLSVYNSGTAASTTGIYSSIATPASSNNGYAIYGAVTSGNGYAYGVRGSSYNSTPQNNGTAIGTYGQAGNATTGYNYGVAGFLFGTQDGTAVYGTTGGSFASIPGKYAGYFEGKIRTTNDAPEKLTSGSWTGYSDGRLKKDTVGFKDGLNVIKRIHPIIYKFKEIGEFSAAETHIGVIAQEVKQVAPYCVGTGKIVLKQSEANEFSADVVQTLAADSTGEARSVVNALTYNYDALIYVLINSVKQLDSTITTLQLQETSNAELQRQLDSLKHALDVCCNRVIKTPTVDVNNRTALNTEFESNKIETANWLAQNKPNPFNKETVIEYNVVQEGKGNILVFDMNGKLLKTIAIKIPGKGSVTITANDLAAGMYYYTLVVNDNEVDTKKMILTQ
jgi:hypothetical protein